LPKEDPPRGRQRKGGVEKETRASHRPSGFLPVVPIGLTEVVFRGEPANKLTPRLCSYLQSVEGIEEALACLVDHETCCLSFHFAREKRGRKSAPVALGKTVPAGLQGVATQAAAAGVRVEGRFAAGKAKRVFIPSENPGRGQAECAAEPVKTGRGKLAAILAVRAPEGGTLAPAAMELLKAAALLLGKALEHLEAEEERNRFVRALRANEERFKLLFHSNQDAVLLMQGDQFVDFNPAAEKMFQLSAQEIRGSTPWDMSPARQPGGEESRMAAKRLIRAARSSGPQFFEWRHRRANGELFEAEVQLNAFQISGNEYVQAIVRDISERVHASAALRESRRSLETLVRNLPGAVYRCANDGEWTMNYISDGCLGLTGYTPSDLEHNRTISYNRLIHKKDRARVRREVEAALKEDRPFQMEYRIIDSRGNVKWIWEQGRGIHDARGNFQWLEGLLMDVTELRRAREELKLSDARFTAFMAHLPSIAFMRDTEGRYVYVNENWEAMTGWSRKDVLGKSVFDLWPEKVAGERLENDQWVAKAGKAYEVIEEIPTQGGSRYFAATKFPIRNEEGEVALLGSVSVDVTDHILSEKALRESERRYRNLFERNLAGAFRSTLDGRLLDCNETFVRAFGYDSKEELFELRAQEFYSEDEGRNRFVEALKEHKVLLGYETHARRKDGSFFWVLENATLIEEPGKEPVIEGVLIDITEMRRAIEDRHQLTQRMKEVQKMEAVGRLASGVAHDFNNILMAILQYAEISLGEKQVPEAVQTHLRGIRDAAGRAGGLTRQLLAFSRNQVMKPRLIDLNEVLVKMGQMLERVIGERYDLHLDLDPEILSVKADPTQIEQVVTNLVINGCDAMHEGGKLEINTGRAVFDDAFCESHPGSRRGNYVAMMVRDSGSGIAPEDLDRIFEPFFTTKIKGKGTGLGLATVYGIVKQSDGYITVESKVGQGSLFTVYLPSVKQTAPKAVDPVTEALPFKGDETILLVEDEPAVREATELTLEGMGYTVLSAGGAAEAQKIFDREKENIHLLLTDMILPDGHGSDLADALRVKLPELRIVYMSGYVDDALFRNETGAEEGFHFLQKPFNASTLAAVIRKALESGA
jgi:two-component system, cell cycle sensor histidine kinase and response regulator CckA